MPAAIWARRKLEDMADARFDFAAVLPAAHRAVRGTGHRAAHPADPRRRHQQPREGAAALALGAAGVQVGTPFAVTEEGDAHPEFKHVLAEAKPEDIVTFMSVAGLPARAVRTPWLARYLESEAVLQARAKKRRDAPSRSTAWIAVRPARRQRRRWGSSASTSTSPPHCAATSSTGCSSAARNRCPSAPGSGRCANSRRTCSAREPSA